MEEYFCPKCGAILNDQYGFSSALGAWKCTQCGQQLMDDDVYEGDAFEGVAWYCDNCNALLNTQHGFSDSYGSCTCTECGHCNGTTEDDIISDGTHSASENFGEAMGSIFAAVAMAQQMEETAKRKERAEERHAFYRRHWKGILITTVSIVLVIAVVLAVWQVRKMIPMSCDSGSLLGIHYEHAIMLLNEAGFTNVRAECTEDLTFENIDKENQVYQVYIFGKNSFDATDKYPYDTRITVKYHGVKLLPTPRSSKDMKGANYTDIVAELESAGFADIQLVVKYDIITGWLTNDGEVESVTINGGKRFTEEDSFRPDAEIIITYHTLKKNKSEE